MTLTQRLVGIVFVLIGFGCFVLAPVVTVRCERRDERVACDVRVKALGLVPLQQIDVHDLKAARVEAQQTTDRSPYGGHDYIDTNWAAVLVGTDGEHRSRFLVSRDRSEIEPLIDAIHRVLAGDDAAADARFGAGLVRMRPWAPKAGQIGLAIAIAYVAFGFVFHGAIGYIVYWTDLLLAGGPWKPPGALDLLAWAKRIAPRSDPLVAILPLGAGIVALRRLARTRKS